MILSYENTSNSLSILKIDYWFRKDCKNFKNDKGAGLLLYLAPLEAFFTLSFLKFQYAAGINHPDHFIDLFNRQNKGKSYISLTAGAEGTAWCT